MHITARIFLLRVVDILVQVSCERPITAGGVGEESAAPLHGEVGGLLYCLHGEISRRLQDNCPLTTDPRDNGRPVFVIVAPPGLALLPAPTRAAPQRPLATALRLPLVASGVIEVIGFHSPRQLAVHLIGQGGIAQPPAPTIARADMHPHLSGNTPR